jgi:hypothetical protein
VCQAVVEAIPGVPDLLKKAGGACSCLPQVIKIATDAKTIAGIFGSGDITVAGAEILKAYGDAMQVSCRWSSALPLITGIDLFLRIVPVSCQ